MRYALALMLLLISCGGGTTVQPPNDNQDPGVAPDPNQPSESDMILLQNVQARLVKLDNNDRYTYQAAPESGVIFGATFYARALNDTVWMTAKLDGGGAIFGTIDGEYKVAAAYRTGGDPSVTFTGTLYTTGVMGGKLGNGDGVTLYPMRMGMQTDQADFEANVLVDYP